jgi:hypothetical protein
MTLLGKIKIPKLLRKFKLIAKKFLGIFQNAQFSLTTCKNSQVSQATQTFSVVWKTS